MADMNENPYEGVDSEEERQVIYQRLLHRYEQSEYERRKTIYSDFMVDWTRERAIQEEVDHRSHTLVSSFAAGFFGISFAFISQLVNLSSAVNVSLLIVSWALFAVTIVLALLQLRIASVIQDKILNCIEKNIEKGYNLEAYVKPSRWLIMFPGRFISWASVGTFVGGLVCLLLFVFQNI